MTEARLPKFDPLDDFDRRDMSFLGTTKRVYVGGTGAGVIVMAEMPGITPLVARFARWVRDAGFTVYMPHLFGSDGANRGAAGTVATMLRTCISKEFRAFAANASSPVTQWLRALAAQAHQECGGAGVGAIGMCFTGNFALSMMLEKSVVAPVLCQPSLPLSNSAGMHIAPDELVAVKTRMEADDLTVLAYRFAGDSFCKAERFKAYEDALGDRFIGTTIADEHANPDSVMEMPHSVVTHHLINQAGEPTRQALDEILAFFAMRLTEAV